jgi:hypothetical protein
MTAEPAVPAYRREARLRLNGTFTIMKRHADRNQVWLPALAILGAPLFAYANPVNIGGEILSFSFIVVAAICFTVEVIVTMAMFKLAPRENLWVTVD